MANRKELEEQAETTGYGATAGEMQEAPPQVLPDPPLQPRRPGEPPSIEPEPPDPQEPWNDPEPPKPDPLERPRPPEMPDQPE